MTDPNSIPVQPWVEFVQPYLTAAATVIVPILVAWVAQRLRAWLGVDMNATMIGECQAMGLDAVAGEAVDFLRERRPASLSAITGFHIVEHMPFARLIALVDEALRALKPGGLLLFETPNPSNILVSTHNFHVDPTHLKPLPSILMSALLESRGFVRIEIRNLFPHPNLANEYRQEVLNDFNRHFYGPQDYGILAWKPAE